MDAIRAHIRANTIMWGIGGLILLGGSIGVGMYGYQRFARLPSVSDVPVTPTPAPLLHWEDPAGLAFDYPDGLDIDIHEDDTTYYAYITFSHPDHPGEVTIRANDAPVGVSGTPISDVHEWIEAQSIYDVTQSLETVLGGETGVKVFTDQDDQLVSVAIYDGLEWIVEGMLTDDAFWRPVFDEITGSFSFIDPIYEDEIEAEYVAPPVEVYYDEVEVLE